MQAAAMVGRVVLVPGKNLTLLDGKSAGGVDLESAADQDQPHAEQGGGEQYDEPRRHARSLPKSLRKNRLMGIK